MARNGRLPASQLASIPGTNERIHVNLIDQTNALRAAFRKRFGKTLSVTDAYRPYGTQVYLRNLYLAGRGNYAVPPGTSNHGWATAIDFGSGVNVYNSREHKWMVANAPRFGYTWLTRAGNGSIEPWHFDAKVVPVSNYAGYLASNKISVPNLKIPDALQKEPEVELHDRIDIKGKKAGKILGLDSLSVEGAFQYGAASLIVAERLATTVNQLRTTLNSVLKAVNAGVSVDEAAIGREVAKELLPDLAGIVETAVEDSEGRSAAEVAQAVVDEMSARLSN